MCQFFHYNIFTILLHSVTIFGLSLYFLHAMCLHYNILPKTSWKKKSRSLLPLISIISFKAVTSACIHQCRHPTIVRCIYAAEHIYAAVFCSILRSVCVDGVLQFWQDFLMVRKRRSFRLWYIFRSKKLSKRARLVD